MPAQELGRNTTLEIRLEVVNVGTANPSDRVFGRFDDVTLRRMGDKLFANGFDP